jgi:stage III sporulation protein AD
MEVLQIVGIGFVTCIAALLLKQIKPELAVLVAMCGGILLLLMTVNYLTEVVGVFNIIVQKTGLSSGIFSIIIKMIGLGYLIEFTANLCQDAGMGGLGDKVLLAGKLMIFTMSLPVIYNIIEIVVELLP